MLDKLPTTPFTVVRVAYKGDRENSESFYYSTDKPGRWYYMGETASSKPDWLLTQEAKIIEFLPDLLEADFPNFIERVRALA